VAAATVARGSCGGLLAAGGLGQLKRNWTGWARKAED
jgi:hypothetical protein